MSTDYRIVPEQQASWQRPVLDVLNSPAGGEAIGDRYLVGDTGADGFAGEDDHIAICTGIAPVVWTFDTPAEGWQVYDVDSGEVYQFESAAWTVNDLSSKANLAVPTAANNVALLAADGDLVDSTVAMADVSGAVSASHTQGTDQALDTGGASEITAAHAKEAYDREASYDSDFNCLIITI